MPSATYLTLLRMPGAARFFLAAAVGRVGLAMTGLGIVWLVHARTGSYADAGLVTGCFALAEALGGPQLGRLADRFGQARVLPCAAAVHAGAIGLLFATGPGTVVGAALAGASLPQLGACSAARWAALLRGPDGADEAALPRAFTLEALANGLSFLAGPALVSAVGAAGHPRLGVLLAVGLVSGGSLALAVQRSTAPPVAGRAERRHAGRALFRPAFARLVALTLALGVFFGAMQVSVTAYAVGRGTPDLAPLLYGVSNCTNLVGGWLYGARRTAAPPTRQLTVAAACLALASLPLLVLDAPLPVAAALALTGLAVPVLLVLSSLLTEAAVPGAALTQAFTWLGSASAAGSAGAAALAGRAVDKAGPHAGFAIGAAAALGMTVLAASPQKPLWKKAQKTEMRVR
ncbi:MFS transporter [Streptomyces sp. NPDC050085]|uniref:MFS transporter n=1 Tax=Streptomyces sp. NPDC050085 TaxID=3365600 RepID=UPI00379938CF